MARSKPTARDALQKLREQRQALDAKERELREAAATELGQVIVECGAETLEPAQFRQLIRQAMALGIDESLRRLAPAGRVLCGGAWARCPRRRATRVRKQKWLGGSDRDQIAGVRCVQVLCMAPTVAGDDRT